MGEFETHRVSCGLLVREGRALLVHRSPSKQWYPDVWDFPGGHLEPGETSTDALIRELKEELDIEAAPPSGDVLLTLRAPDVELDIWRVDEWEGDIVNAAPDEHVSIGWFTSGEAEGLKLADLEYRQLLSRVLSSRDPR